MLATAPPSQRTRTDSADSLGLRERLKHATADAHRALDAAFVAYDLVTLDGYRRFLEASAAALLPLETALVAAGVAGIFPDWAMRARRAAILADLARVGGIARPLRPVRVTGRNGVLGTMYVLEGSRLGAAFLLRAIAESGNPDIVRATAYLGHGAGGGLWRSFLLRLEREPVTPEDETEIKGAALDAFALFAGAAARQ